MFSYWEQQSFLQYDHIIIGAGIVGLSVGIELRGRFPKDRILVLERGFMPTGASSRNAGFACMGSLTELLTDLELMNEAAMLQLFAMRKSGLERLRERLGDRQIDYCENGSYELIDEKAVPALERMDDLNRLLFPLLGKDAFRRADQRIADFGFAAQFTKALVENTAEGELDTGKMLRALTDLALQNNIEIKTGVSVQRFEEQENGVRVFVPDTLRREEWVLQCRKLYLCTNAFTPELLSGEIVKPGRGQVLLTHVIPGLKFRGIFHMDDGYYYFRELHGRVLFGGGRNLDFETETTTALQLNEEIQNKLGELLRTVILPGTPFEVAQRWSGIMAFGPTKQPIVKAFSTRIYGAFRMGGMGLALGSEVAYQLVHTLLLDEK
ncbi:MAG: FAD-binding oxidoreductase [Chitinophagaceae bacterium]|nr:FAD-binding oxidoreductase [Chitinophagaceae bacterium]